MLSLVKIVWVLPKSAPLIFGWCGNTERGKILQRCVIELEAMVIWVEVAEFFKVFTCKMYSASVLNILQEFVVKYRHFLPIFKKSDKTNINPIQALRSPCHNRKFQKSDYKSTMPSLMTSQVKLFWDWQCALVY